MLLNLLTFLAIVLAQVATVVLVRHAASEPFKEAYRLGYDIGYERASADAEAGR